MGVFLILAQDATRSALVAVRECHCRVRAAPLQEVRSVRHAVRLQAKVIFVVESPAERGRFVRMVGDAIVYSLLVRRVDAAIDV